MDTVLKDVEIIVDLLELSKSHDWEDNLTPFFLKLSFHYSIKDSRVTSSSLNSAHYIGVSCLINKLQEGFRQIRRHSHDGNQDIK